MTLLKGLPIYKDFQSDAKLVPKPGCRSESLGELFVSSCPEWLLKYRFSKKKKKKTDSRSSLIHSKQKQKNTSGGGAGKSVFLKNPSVTKLLCSESFKEWLALGTPCNKTHFLVKKAKATLNTM